MKRIIWIATAAVLVVAINVGASTSPSQCSTGESCSQSALVCAPASCSYVACSSACPLTSVRAGTGTGSYFRIAPTVAKALGKAIRSAARSVIGR